MDCFHFLRPIFLLLITSFSVCLGRTAKVRISSARFSHVDDNRLGVITRQSDMVKFMGPILDPLLRVRVAGTPENVAVRKYIVNFLERLSAPWQVEIDSFNDVTPLGNKNFGNIVATLNPIATRRLVLACHFDSKYFAHGEFIGATDSAVPCAMLLDIARIFDSIFKQSGKSSSVTLQLLFFDGEEAFVKWSATDSIYGARHLAAVMQSRPHPDQTRQQASELDAIDAFVLLDLIGTQQAQFYNHFSSTSVLYQQLQQIEQRLKSLGLLHGYRGAYFPGKPPYVMRIEDDHIPFLHRGVPILHLITVPFPSVWHDLSDNKDSLDADTIDNLNRILRVFVVQYLHLNINDVTGRSTAPAVSTPPGRLTWVSGIETQFSQTEDHNPAPGTTVHADQGSTSSGESSRTGTEASPSTIVSTKKAGGFETAGSSPVSSVLQRAVETDSSERVDHTKHGIETSEQASPRTTPAQSEPNPANSGFRDGQGSTASTSNSSVPLLLVITPLAVAALVALVKRS